MPTREELEALAVRCEQASGADRELDKLVVQAAYPEIGEPAPHCVGDEPIFWRDPYYKRCVPKLTASTDAILALIAEKLPGWRYRVGLDDGAHRAAVFEAGAGRSLSRSIILHNGATDALALCASFLRALAASQENQ